MSRFFLPLLFLTVIQVTVLNAQTVSDLRCEYLHDPLGIDDLKPRLSWILQSDRRGTMQTACQILVASSPELLARDKGDLWDSGQVESDRSTQVEYGGAQLQSREICWWKVRVWDERGTPTPWSEPARWEMGLLKPGDWQAKWIDAPTFILSKPIHGTLSILHASYDAIDGTGGADVTALVAKKFSHNSLVVAVSNESLGGDPAPQHAKLLRVAYAVDGTRREATAAEGTTLAIPGNEPSLHYLRKDFMLGKAVSKARLYATALGLYELRLNGRRVGDHLFAPDWTDYGRRVRYQVYDVTSFVKQGPNALGGLVGNGWYCGHIGNGGFQVWGKEPALFAQLEVTFADGSTECVATDAAWKTHPGPVLSSNIMLGENYDARREIAGWDQPGLDTGKWSAATERAEKPRLLDGQVDQPVCETGELHPKAMTEPKPGRWTIDFGQNLVGFVRLKVSCPAGTKITLRHAEMLDAHGSIYTANLRAAAATDTYVCKGGGMETWQPRFTFHGFRYVEVSGLAKAPGNDTVTAIVVGSGIPPAGQFGCSSPEINQLQSNIQWGMRGNYFSVPTDCPQRDERLGWMGDAEVFVRTAAYNGDIPAFFTKWLVDVDDAQSSKGVFTDVSPSPRAAGSGTPAWGDAGVICPWTIYLMYGDKRILEEHLPAMRRWVDWCAAHSTGFIRNRDRGGDYGDWLSQGESTSKELIGTAFFAHSASLLSQALRVTSDTAGADKYQQLFEQIKAAFDKHYVNADGSIQNGTQTAGCLALRFDLLPDDLRSGAGARLVEDIKAHDYHLTTGFVGVSHLLPVLCSIGEVDAAYRVFQQETFPSWLFSVKHGATTIWERWDGWTPEKGFQNPGMNSFNHYSLGSCGEWMFETVAGIGVDATQPGFKHIVIRPRPGGNLTHAEASYDSVYGRISTKWNLAGGDFFLSVTVPPNTTATVVLPTANSASITEGGTAVTVHPEIKPMPGGEDNAQYLIGSGNYDFSCSVP